MTPTVRALAAITVLLSIACGFRQAGNGQPQRPNILLIVSDDLVYADLGIHGSRDRPIVQLDVLPTVLGAAGVATNASEFDGVNLLPFLTGAATGAPHDLLYWRFGGMMAIRRGDWKLVKARDGPLVDVDPSVLGDLSEAGLYNLSEDIGETRNRASDRPDKVKELSDLWQRWNRQLAKPLWGPQG
jgi:arylsulfatase A-like enzyme